MRQRSTAVFVSIVLACGAIAGTASPAGANFGSIACGTTTTGVTSCVNLANNSTHSVRYNSIDLINGIGISTQWAITNAYNTPTDLNMYRDDADSVPDVEVFDNNYGDNGAVGWVQCDGSNTGAGGAHPNFYCRGQLLRYNAAYPYDFANETRRRQVACHELGHTVGLRHWNDDHGGTHSCMYTPATGSTSTLLSSHEITDHINPRY